MRNTFARGDRAPVEANELDDVTIVALIAILMLAFTYLVR